SDATSDPLPEATLDDGCSDGPSDSNDCACAGCPDDRCFEGVCDGAAIVQVSAGGHFGCALRKSGTVWCWGSNSAGQLGRQDVPFTCTTLDRLVQLCEPDPIEIDGLRDVVYISAGANSVCAVTRDHRVWCWGSNQYGQLGHEVDPALGD